VTTFVLFSVLVPLVVGLLANELFAVQLWLTRKIVWLAARIDADCPDEVRDTYAENMAEINASPGHLWGLLTAFGLLFKVAVARRVRDGALVAWCVIKARSGLVRVARAQRRATPRPRAKSRSLYVIICDFA